jgi:6-phosphofructokinase 1
VIAVVGGRGLSILYKLHRKGLNIVGVPRSIENDIAATAVSFGFNSALSFTIEMLDRAREAAQSARKIAVVEVLGAQAGWIALQAGIAARADAVLMPETPCHLRHLAARLKDKLSHRRPWGLVVVAEGAQLLDDPPKQVDGSSIAPIGASPRLSATGKAGAPIVPGPGQAAETVATRLRPRIEGDVYPLVIGPWARGGNPTAVDQQLGMAYGAGAVQVLKAGRNGVMVAFAPPEITFVPLAEAVGKVRIVPHDSEFMRIAQSLGIYLGTGL